MARTMQTRKRSGGPISRPFKKARTSRRRRRRGKKTSNFTSQSGVGGGIRFKSRKISRRRYKNMLWNSTMMKKHWRSVISANSTLASPVVAGSMTPEISTALRFGGNNFWVTAGGAINPDGGAVGTFPTDEDFLIRGGRIGIRFTNLIDSVATTQETIHVYAYLIRTGRGYNPGVLPTSVPIGWDPSMLTDFGTTVGRIVLQKQFLLEDRNSASLEYRIPIQKIDASDYAAGRNTWVWLYMVGNADSNASRSMGVYPYYNLSFTADQV